MTTTTKNPEKVDTDNPEWTEQMFKEAKPASEILPSIIKRGNQIAPVKISTTIRLSADVIDYFKSDGKGWQSRLDAVLQEHIKKHVV